MFERFTDRARRVLVEAQSESTENRHGFLGTEHILIGIVRMGEGIGYEALAASGVELGPLREKVGTRLEEWVDPKRHEVSHVDALASIGIDLGAVRSRLEETFGPNALPDPYARPPFTPKAKESLERALRRALMLRNRYIGVEHELLGVLEIRDGVACQALLDLGVDLDMLDADVVARAAPEQSRAAKSTQAAIALGVEVRRLELDDEQRERARAIADELTSRYLAAMSAEQAEVNRLAAVTADTVEEAMAAARQALAAAGITF